MKMINMKWVLVGVPLVLVVLGAAGISIASLLPFVFVLACPLMMMGMHGGHGREGKTENRPDVSSADPHDH